MAGKTEGSAKAKAVGRKISKAMRRAWRDKPERYHAYHRRRRALRMRKGSGDEPD